ncbi:MAG: hypothetical protein AABX75_02995 [Nanoarchaeota archaeon]
MHLIAPCPQSSVFGAQFIVQNVPLQSGAKFLLTAESAWQHRAGTQSESEAQENLSSVSAGIWPAKNKLKATTIAIAIITPKPAPFIATHELNSI